jgi:hypothetical protein
MKLNALEKVPHARFRLDGAEARECRAVGESSDLAICTLLGVRREREDESRRSLRQTTRGCSYENSFGRELESMKTRHKPDVPWNTPMTDADYIARVQGTLRNHRVWLLGMAGTYVATLEASSPVSAATRKRQCVTNASAFTDGCLRLRSDRSRRTRLRATRATTRRASIPHISSSERKGTTSAMESAKESSSSIRRTTRSAKAAMSSRRKTRD